MSDLIEVAGGPRTAKIGDGEYVFEELSVYDKAKLLRKMKDGRKLQIIADAKNAGLEAAQGFLEAQGHEDVSYGESKFITLANDREGGQLAILSASLEKTYPGKGEELSQKIKWNFGQLTETVAHVGGLTLSEPEYEQDAELPPADRYANPPA